MWIIYLAITTAAAPPLPIQALLPVGSRGVLDYPFPIVAWH